MTRLSILAFLFVAVGFCLFVFILNKNKQRDSYLPGKNEEFALWALNVTLARRYKESKDQEDFKESFGWGKTFQSTESNYQPGLSNSNIINYVP